jgi:hypothetical protein
VKILIQIEIFECILDKSGGVMGQVQKTLLESGEGGRHIRCPKLESPVYETGYSSFDWTEKYGGTLEKA